MRTSSGIHRGCSITARDISTIHSPPSGPVRTCAGRNQLSVEVSNSCFFFPRRPLGGERHALRLQDAAVQQ